MVAGLQGNVVTKSITHGANETHNITAAAVCGKLQTNNNTHGANDWSVEYLNFSSKPHSSRPFKRVKTYEFTIPNDCELSSP